MFQDEYDKVEQPAIQQLQALGWTYMPGEALEPEPAALDPTSTERGSYKEVVLEGRLRAALERLNPWLSPENLNKVVRELIQIPAATLMEANQWLHERLVNCLSVEQDLGTGRKGQTVRLMDFDNPANNDFLVTSQFKVQGPTQNIIPDILLFVNGLPIAVIECKSPYITSPMSEGINQLRRYANLRAPEDQEGAERLFWYNQMMVCIHRSGATVGTISSRAEHYLEWKDAYPLTDSQVSAWSGVQRVALDDVAEAPAAYHLGQDEVTPQQRLLAGLFNPANCLDLIQNFVLYEPVEGRIIKKLARYQQFRAVHKAIARLKNGRNAKARGGVIWHTQGSGKSLTMVMLAVKLRRDPALRDYKLVFITDRTQLDQQLTATFEKAQGETVLHAGSVKELQTLLQRDTSDLVTAMVQKFREVKNGSFPLLNASEKILVLADEAHRTQYGSLGAALNTALPNAARVAFTGTPLLKDQKTAGTFGAYIDTYKIDQAVADGATVQIFYEGREARTKVTGDSLDKLFDAYFGDKTEEEQEVIRKKFGTELAVLEAPQRIRWICIDLLQHFRDKIQPNGFKAMIVTPSRHSATLYKKMLEELEGPPAEVIISGKQNDESYLARYTDKARHKQAISDFCNPRHPLSFLIVKDMLLTGFDAPICQVMYLDRKLTDHTLLQAIARVNRTYQDKHAGYIVDYYGLADYLHDALKDFSSEDVAGTFKRIKDELPRLRAAHTRVMQFFKGLSLEDVDACVLALKQPETRAQFEQAFLRFANQMDIVLPDAAAARFLPDLKRLGRIKVAARNHYRDKQLDITDAGEKVRQLIEEHLHAVGVDSKIPPVQLLSPDFKQSLDKVRSPQAKASEVEHAIRSHISVKLEEDPVYYRKLSERLEEILRKHKDQWDKQLELLLELREGLEEERTQQAEELGLNETEYAFHNILCSQWSEQTDEEVLPEAVHQEVIETTKALVAMMDEATEIVDFFAKEDEVKRIKRDIKRALMNTRHFKALPLIKAVQQEFLELAKVRFGNKHQ